MYGTTEIRLFGCGIPQSIARVVQSFYFFPFPILHKLYRNLPGVFQEHLLSDLQQEERSRICGTPGKKKKKNSPSRHQLPEQAVCTADQKTGQYIACHSHHKIPVLS